MPLDAEVPRRRVAALGVGLAQVEVDAHPKAGWVTGGRIGGGGHGGATARGAAGSAGSSRASVAGSIAGIAAAGRRTARPRPAPAVIRIKRVSAILVEMQRRDSPARRFDLLLRCPADLSETPR
ncbi:hypothetical protein MRA01_45640 [Methylobacterium radiotolerans]|nr:hypothetical protein MRA01_45640 [Methylobacterium radiotolerans]